MASDLPRIDSAHDGHTLTGLWVGGADHFPLRAQRRHRRQTDARGRKACFSQAGSVNSLRDSGGAYSSAASCIGEWFADDGNSYVMKCDFANSPDRTCLVNGAVARTVSDNSRCLDLSACGFPRGDRG